MSELESLNNKLNGFIDDLNNSSSVYKIGLLHEYSVKGCLTKCKNVRVISDDSYHKWHELFNFYQEVHNKDGFESFIDRFDKLTVKNSKLIFGAPFSLCADETIANDTVELRDKDYLNYFRLYHSRH